MLEQFTGVESVSTIKAFEYAQENEIPFHYIFKENYDVEIKKLSSLAEKYQIPLMVDNAYGLPFPNIVFTDDAKPYWDKNIILSMSLSKIGLPALRTGIIIADEKIITAMSNINAIAALASGSL